jgi:oligosaccharide repeat unit polymerase
MMALLGYRTEVLAAIIAPVLTAYYCKIFKFRDLAIFAVLAFAAFIGLSFIRTGGMAFSGRATTTITAFDTLVSSTPIFGSTTGYIQFADFIKVLTKIPMYGGRILTGTLIGARPGVSITTTLYGPPYADFGVFGLIFLFFFGLMMGAGYKSSKHLRGAYAGIHSLLLAFILLGVETGIADGIIWMYFIFAGVFYFISHKYES